MVRCSIAIIICHLAVIFLFAVPSISNSKTITTPQIIAHSVSADCLDWRISGICLWLKCTILGCYVVSTPKIAHRLPDFVVTAYPQTANSPWEEIRSIFSAIKIAPDLPLSGGNLAGVGTDFLHQESLRFNEVDIIGNPALAFNQYAKFLCQSEVQPLVPYYLSVLDAFAWRSGALDLFKSETLTRGEREIGKWPEFTWGSVYPRSGFVLQNHSGKAAAVASQRAIDILLRNGERHVHKSIFKAGKKVVVRGNTDAKKEQACQLSGGLWKVYPRINEVGTCEKQTWHQWLSESNEKIDKWQILAPSYSQNCETFGQNPHWPHKEVASDDAYVWNYWRTYKCCTKAGGILLQDFEF